MGGVCPPVRKRVWSRAATANVTEMSRRSWRVPLSLLRAADRLGMPRIALFEKPGLPMRRRDAGSREAVLVADPALPCRLHGVLFAHRRPLRELGAEISPGGSTAGPRWPAWRRYLLRHQRFRHGVCDVRQIRNHGRVAEIH